MSYRIEQTFMDFCHRTLFVDLEIKEALADYNFGNTLCGATKK